MYAIIETGGKQYKVAQGDVIRVEMLNGTEPGVSYTFENVLLVSDGTGIKVGAPYLAGAKVSATVTKHDRAKKVIIYKYKAKKGFHKKKGHRQPYTELQIGAISV
ncbi:MAG: 50S ribosomal protein L21 [Defluviitaleaceae bacterium]|nr:50S ribosomal protein L21 [Defluviitaleaceae bacterium]